MHSGQYFKVFKIGNLVSVLFKINHMTINIENKNPKTSIITEQKVESRFANSLKKVTSYS